MPIKYAVDDETGEKTAFRSAIDSKGEVMWVSVPLNSIPSKTPSRRRGRGVKYGAAIKEVQYQQELDLRGKAAQRRSEETRSMGLLEKSMIRGGREITKLAAGAGNIADFVLDAAGSKSAMKWTSARRKDQDEQDRLYREFDESAGIGSALLGSSLPYLISGYGAGPMVAKAGTALISAPAKVAGKAATRTRGSFSKMIEKGAKRDDALGDLSQKVKREWTDPLAKRASMKSRQIKEVDPYRKGLLGEVIGGGILGAVEGGIHYDNNIIDGMIAGTFGSTSGAFAKPYVTRAPKYWNPNEQRIVDWAKDQGMKFLPGMKTGSRSAQRFEQGLRQDDSWTDVINQFDRNNDAVVNRIAFKAAGIPEGTIDNMGPKQLDGHMKSLRNEYEELTAKSVGRFEPRNMAALEEIMKTAAKAGTKESKAALKDLAAYHKEIKKMSTETRDSRGRFKKATFNGRKYQELRIRMKEDMDAAWKKDNMYTYRGLKAQIDQLDIAMSIGVKDFGGMATATHWKDLNERWAMTKLIIEKGLDPLGKFDANKMGKHLMSKEPQGLLLESSGRINDLYKITKLNHMIKNQAGSAFSSDKSRLRNKSTLTLPQHVLGSRFLEIPVAKMLGPVSSAYMSLYKRGWPAATGLLNMSGTKWGNPLLYTRAAAQGSQAHPKALDYVQRKAGNAYQGITNWWEE